MYQEAFKLRVLRSRVTDDQRRHAQQDELLPFVVVCVDLITLERWSSETDFSSATGEAKALFADISERSVDSQELRHKFIPTGEALDLWEV